MRSEGEAGCKIKAVKVYNCAGSREKGLLHCSMTASACACAPMCDAG